MYAYKSERDFVFSESGQEKFLAIRDRVNALLSDAGAVSMIGALRGSSGSAWSLMACVDRLVELGELREITGQDVAGQNRVFVRGRK